MDVVRRSVDLNWKQITLDSFCIIFCFLLDIEQVTKGDKTNHMKEMLFYVLRAPVCKNQTNSKFRGKGGKFYFFHILTSDRLGYN